MTALQQELTTLQCGQKQKSGSEMLNRFFGFFIVPASLTMMAEPAPAQGLAGKTVRIIVPYAAGGTGDVVARVLGQAITQKTGQTIVVEIGRASCRESA